MKVFKRFQTCANYCLVLFQVFLPDIYEEHMYIQLYRGAWCQGGIKLAFTFQTES